MWSISRVKMKNTTRMRFHFQMRLIMISDYHWSIVTWGVWARWMEEKSTRPEANFGSRWFSWTKSYSSRDRRFHLHFDSQIRFNSFVASSTAPSRRLEWATIPTMAPLRKFEAIAWNKTKLSSKQKADNVSKCCKSEENSTKSTMHWWRFCPNLTWRTTFTLCTLLRIEIFSNSNTVWLRCRGLSTKSSMIIYWWRSCAQYWTI